MEKLIKIIFLIFAFNISLMAAIYTGPVDIKEVLKYKEDFKKARKITNPILEKEFNQLTKNIINNNYHTSSKKEKEMLIGFFLYAIETGNKNIDKNTKIGKITYNPKTDTIIYEKIVYNIKNDPQYPYLKKVDNNTFFYILQLIGKNMANLSAIKLCNKSISFPYTFTILNSGTTIREDSYYEYKPNKKIFTTLSYITKNTCKDIEKYKSPDEWLYNKPEMKELTNIITKYQ